MLTRIILLLLTLILPASGFAAQSTAPASASRLIVVGGNSNYPPYQFLDKYGQPAGYIVDLTKAIASVRGMQVEIRLGDFGAILKQLDSGEVDVLEGLSFSETRAREFDFST